MSNAPAIRPSARLLPSDVTVHLVNPSHLSFGAGVITPRRLFVLGAATPASYGSPLITDETLEPFDVGTVQPGDVVGVGIHTGNALRGYELGTLARARDAAIRLRALEAAASTCGVRSRRCTVVRSTARSARSGEPMARRRDSVEPDNV